jgi:hypothetical protein
MPELRVKRWSEGPLLWRRAGIGFGGSDWPWGYSKQDRYRGMVTQWNFRIGPVSLYRIVLWRNTGGGE